MKKLFWLLMPYFNERYYPGQGIRWIIRNQKGKTPYCICCGSYANMVGLVQIGRVTFNLPLCKAHAGSYMDKHTDKPWELIAPGALRINPRFKTMIR